MNVSDVEAQVQLITDAPGLDPIHVIWIDLEMGSGYCTVMCYGSAWTVYFGAMGKLTIRQFFADVGVDYLVPKMGITPHLKATKRDHAYLAKIINAVKQSIALTETESRQQHDLIGRF